MKEFIEYGLLYFTGAGLAIMTFVIGLNIFRIFDLSFQNNQSPVDKYYLLMHSYQQDLTAGLVVAMMCGAGLMTLLN